MYFIIDFCYETSGWHLPGLHCVKETAPSFVAQTSFSEHRGNLATMSPVGLNILRCPRVFLHILHCTTEHCQEREFVLSRMWLAPLQHWQVIFQLLLASRRRLQNLLHEALRVQNSWSQLQFSWKNDFVKPHSTTWYCACDVLCASDSFWSQTILLRYQSLCLHC